MVQNYADIRRVAKVVNELFVQYLDYFVHQQPKELDFFLLLFFEVELLLKMPKQLEKYSLDHVYSVEY